MLRALAARLISWLCLVIGMAFLIIAVVLVIRAVGQASEISAYQQARACPAGASPKADCLQRVHGSVAAVTEDPGNPGERISAVWALDVRTRSTTLHLTFGSDSPMLSFAVDGDPAVVTSWRGIPISVVTDGRSDATAAVPETAFWADLRGSAEVGFGSALFLFVAWAIRRHRTAGATWPLSSPLLAALLRPPPVTRPARKPLRTRLHPANWVRGLDSAIVAFVSVLLTFAVAGGIVGTAQNGPRARAFRHAPACVGETNLTTCVGDFTAVVNGVRSPTNANYRADVAFVTPSGAINAWATFEGDTATIVRQASADERAQTQLTIKVWRRSVIGADFGSHWHWAQGDPPTDRIPPVFLAASFALLLLVVRLRIHLQARSNPHSELLVADDLGQVVLAAGSVALLAEGFWAGGILAVAVLVWLGWSGWQSTHGRRVALSAQPSS